MENNFVGVMYKKKDEKIGIIIIYLNSTIGRLA